MTPEREARLQNVASTRQFDLTILLENVHDSHNVSAVLRSCDAVGIPKIYRLNSDDRLQTPEYIEFSKRASAGSRKWVQVETFENLDDALTEIRRHHDILVGASLTEGSTTLHDLDLTRNMALVFGNEHEGISTELLSQLDGWFTIPQFGMVQSLNVSVACAVTMFEAMRQKSLANHYDGIRFPTKAQALLSEFELIHQGLHSYMPDGPED